MCGLTGANIHGLTKITYTTYTTHVSINFCTVTTVGQGIEHEPILEQSANREFVKAHLVTININSPVRFSWRARRKPLDFR